MKIKDTDLRIDTFTNGHTTAMRIIYLPTSLTVNCNSTKLPKASLRQLMMILVQQLVTVGFPPCSLVEIELDK